jgi:hypothetical protein
MGTPLRVKEIAQFNHFPAEWNLIRVSVDWNGKPLLLFEEGRPPFPASIGGQELAVWYRTSPTAHHIVSFDRDRQTTNTIRNDDRVKDLSFVQQIGEHWLLVEGRGGAGRIYARDGVQLKTLDLGDAIQDVQTTADGRIWVSYFDEGVFGNGIGSNGLVCFDFEGNDVFRFEELAQATRLPHIDDCYALNATQGEVWLSYYSEFPLLCLSDFTLQKSWQGLGSFSAFAVRGQQLLALRSYGSKMLVEINLSDRTEQQFDPIDTVGIPLADFRGRLYQQFAGANKQYYKPFQATARGSEMYLYTEDALFRVP